MAKAKDTPRQETIHERIKFVQGNMYDFVNALNFISEAANSAHDVDKLSVYIPDLIRAMIEKLAVYANDRAKELFRDLGIDEPKEATGGEV